jgi:hypothetical protein
MTTDSHVRCVVTDVECWDGWDGLDRWDVPSTQAMPAMRGRKTSDQNVQLARELRRRGLSVREIGRRLRISRSAPHRFTQDVAIEYPSHQSELQTEPSAQVQQNTAQYESTVRRKTLADLRQEEADRLWGRQLSIQDEIRAYEMVPPERRNS